MFKMYRLVLVLGAAVALLACGPKGIPASERISAAAPSATAVPTATPRPSPTLIPTASEMAPEETFTSVGEVTVLKGGHGIAGRVTVAGLQTLIIQGFTFDGKGPKADIRLVLGTDYSHPAAILTELQQQAYEDSLLVLIIPSSLKRGSADTVVVYSPEAGEAYATGAFH